MSTSRSLCFILACLAVLAAAPTRAAEVAELVLRNGAIYTLDARQPWVEAVAIRGGKYVAVGRNADMAAWVGAATKVVDLHGAMAMPGINDVHQHPLDGGYEMLFACNFAAQSDFDAMLKSIEACAQKSQPGDWIVGGAWGSQHLERLAHAAALAALDRASAGHPVFLRDDTYHNRWVNSVVLARAGIGADTPDPEAGVIVKDPATGRPTGLLKEFSAFQAIEAQIPPRQPERLAQAAAQAIRSNNSLGITGIQDAYSLEDHLKVWRALDRESGLNAWMVASLPAGASADPEQRAGEALVRARDEYRTAHLRPDFVKLFLDGVPPARTAHFIEPYVEDAEHGANFRGQSNYTLAQLGQLLTRLDKLAVAAKIHATGDGSVRLALDAIEQARVDGKRESARSRPQHQIAHASFIAPADLRRFAALNVTADQSPMLWFPTGLWMATAAVIGPERAARFWPVRELIASGALVAGGSDWPAGQTTPNPWIGIEGLVTRRNPLREIPGALWPEQAIDLATALKVYTLNSAAAMGLVNLTGSVTVGKSADLIVLDRHLFKIAPEQLHATAVLRTYFQGKLVYSAE